MHPEQGIYEGLRGVSGVSIASLLYMRRKIELCPPAAARSEALPVQIFLAVEPRRYDICRSGSSVRARRSYGGLPAGARPFGRPLVLEAQRHGRRRGSDDWFACRQLLASARLHVRYCRICKTRPSLAAVFNARCGMHSWNLFEVCGCEACNIRSRRSPPRLGNQCR